MTHWTSADIALRGEDGQLLQRGTAVSVLVVCRVVLEGWVKHECHCPNVFESTLALASSLVSSE